VLSNGDIFNDLDEPLMLFSRFSSCISQNGACFRQSYYSTLTGKEYQNVCILDFIGAKDDRSGGNNWSYKSCKAPVKASAPAKQHTAFRGRMSFLLPNQ